MNIKLNGESAEFDAEISVSDLIKAKKLDADGVVVELNMDIIRKNQRDATIIKEGDVVEILHFVGGG